MKASFTILMVVLALATSAVCSMAQATDSIVGTWRLVSWTEEETQSKAVHKHFGDHPNGLITFTSDGRMMIMFTDPSRKPPATPKATDAEAAQLYRTMVAYAGKYRTESNKLIMTPEVSWNQAWNGMEQTRFFEIQGDRFQYQSTPFVSPILDKEMVTTLVWERVK
jgi:Lipocalin-like domain